eukprot:TRINITY_DN9005_c0_g1_i1.p1 TRINITY_DN9005_c0_g1~~TRINITY_DN9005_c0_g1_i1.p1  ORF type:complete len:350 (-),score=102.57 TRINITY_DN9005_c0_g1_i1:108-1157(-)
MLVTRHMRQVLRRQSEIGLLSAEAATEQSSRRCISGTSEEIRIPVPYGHIAGKAWGDPNGRPILGLHGWLDNAATHDHLVPLLSEGYRLVCLDQPGHGLSSHYPAGMNYKVSDAFTFLRRVLDHLKWDKTIIMGHSMGGGIGLWYSAMFPEQVERLICIDLISFGSMPLKKHVNAARKSVLETMKVQVKMENPKVPTYSFEDACGRAFMASNLINGLGSISKESVETLMSRGLIKTPDGSGYTWSADLRLRIPTAFNMVQEITEEFGSKVECPHLLIKATEASKYMTDESYDKILKVFMQNNPHFQYRELPGGHHLHLNTPELVAPVINKFLEKDFSEPDQDRRAHFDL